MKTLPREVSVRIRHVVAAHGSSYAGLDAAIAEAISARIGDAGSIAAQRRESNRTIAETIADSMAHAVAQAGKVNHAR